MINTGIPAGDFTMPQRQQESCNVDLVKRSMTPLDLTAAGDYSSHINAYFSYYSLNIPDVTHYFGTFASQGFTLAAHLFDPDETRGLVFLLHGYYDHTGILANIIRLCTENHLAVAVFDFPGHGLSSGTTVSINSFSQYVDFVRDFFKFCQSHFARPYYLIAHSMGGAVAFEYLYQTTESRFERVVLCAPLIRSSLFLLSRIGYTLIKPFSNITPRWFRNSSSDKLFLRFFHSDPLQCRHFPLQWAQAFYAWNREVRDYTEISAPVTIIQGTRDTVVDWRYNIPFLQRKIRGAEVVYIKKARHQLMNEGEPYLSKFLSTLQKVLLISKHNAQ